MASPVQRSRCLIVGGGVSGLALAWYLKRGAPGHKTLVLESATRPGGVIQSLNIDGCIVETGAATFLTREPALMSLIQDLGLGSRLRPAARSAGRRLVYTRGKLRALNRNPLSVLTSGVLTAPGVFRALKEPWIKPAHNPGESVREFAARRFGAEAADILFAALAAGTSTGDIQRLEAESVFPRMVEWEQRHGSVLKGAIQDRKEGRGSRPDFSLAGFDQGMEVLTRGLAEALGDSLVCGAPVERVERTSWGWRVAAGEMFECEHLVLAVPPSKAAKLLRPAHRVLADLAASIESAPVAAVTFAAGRAGIPAGFGFLTPPAEGLPILGCMFSSHVFPEHAPGDRQTLRVMLGGVLNPEAATGSQDRVVETARAGLASVLGALPLDLLHVVQWAEGIPQYNMGHAERIKAMDAESRSLSTLHFCGNGYRGTGVGDCVREALNLASRLTADWNTPS